MSNATERLDKNALNGINYFLLEFIRRYETAVCQSLGLSQEIYRKVWADNVEVDPILNAAFMNVFDQQWINLFDDLNGYRQQPRYGCFVVPVNGAARDDIFPARAGIKKDDA